jgi:hypothetical protein
MAFETNHVTEGLPIYCDLARVDSAVEKLRVLHAWDTRGILLAAYRHTSNNLSTGSAQVEHSLCEKVC